MSGSRRPTLEAARGVIVSAVVAYHALRLVLLRHGGEWGEVSAVWWPAATGRFGVDAFFVLAGSLVVASWHRCREVTTTRLRAVREFARRRGWRILPPYLAMLAVVVPLTAPQVLGDGADLVRLLTLQQYLDPELTNQVNVPIWSLTTEGHFYLVAPLVAVVVARRSGAGRLVLPAAVLAASTLAVWWAHTDLRGDLPAGLLPGRIDQFLLGAAAGVLIGRWERGEQPRAVRVLTRPAALPTLLVALVAIGTYHGATWRSGADGLLPLLVHPAAAWLLAGLLVRLSCGPAPGLLRRRALVQLGGVSFSLYLWHYPILEHGVAMVDPAQPTGLVLLFAAVLVAAAVVVATVLRDLLEVPTQRREAARRDAPRRASGSAVLEAELRLQDREERTRAERHEVR